MGGLFGVVSKQDCVNDLFYGTDYHSHLGTKRGGLAVKNSGGLDRVIHNIENAQFKSKFESDILKMHGSSGIGVISDYEDQPLIIGSHLGTYAIATVGRISNLDALAKKIWKEKRNFSEMGGNEINPTELVAHLISQGDSFEEGIKNVQEVVDGSCSMLLLTDDGIYAARDKLGRTPIVIGRKQGSYAAASETCSFPNLKKEDENMGFEIERYLGPGEIVLVTPDRIDQKGLPRDEMHICSFLWVYYGFPASSYEGINVEVVRYRCGAALAREDEKDGIKIDMVTGIPDSGTAHGLGYAEEARIPFKRPFVKYTPTWPRSFMPQDQKMRNLVAKMKLIPIRELIRGQRILFCEDSIVRGTQLQDTIQVLYEYGAAEVHMRPACPPLVYGCNFLNFSRSKSVMDLAARKSVGEIEGTREITPELLIEYSNQDSEKHRAMNERTRIRLNLTTLKYQRLDNLVEAIGLPRDKLCLGCWSM